MKQCEQISGIPATAIREIAERYVSARASSLVQCVDYNGLYANTTISLLHAANLALLSGHLGRPGAGIFPLLTHCNEQGSYDMGISPRMFPGQIDCKDHGHNARIAKLWKMHLSAPIPSLAEQYSVSPLSQGREAFNSKMQSFSSPFFMVLEWFLFAFVLFHSFNGIRIVLVDWADGVKYHKILYRYSVVIAVIMFFAMGYLMFSHEIHKFFS